MQRPSYGCSMQGGPDVWRTLAKPGHTIVKLCEGGNEPPLIIIHGGGGTIHAFGPLQERFKSALWAIQVTPDTPLETLMDQADFYYLRIKEMQPKGPYRLAAFSATSIIAFALAGIFEQHGNAVSQLALIDHFPATFLAPVLGLNASQRPLDHPAARNEFLAASISNLLAMTRRDGGGNVPKRLQLANDLSAAYDERPIFDFLLSLSVESTLPALPALHLWLQKVKAPVSAYLGSYGMLGSVRPEHSASWYDLGIHQCFPNARVTFVTAGHFDILANEAVIDGLQSGYIFQSKM
ncbi:Alpha/Beta hydrolase protein [Mucidula mucida]|nr:Alpha/Beta hydrolase protein [Mucidula mucida]